MAKAASPALLLVACLGVAGLGLCSVGPAAPAALTGHAKQKPLQQPMPAVRKDLQRVDALGDPLPAGAIMRLGSMRLRPPGICRALAFSPVRDQLVSQSDGVITFWDASTGKELHQIRVLETGWAAKIVLSPDGNVLAGLAKQTVLWDAATGKEIRRLPTTEGTASLAFSPRGDVLATADELTVKLWEVASGKLLNTLQSNTGKRTKVAFSPDGQTVAAAGAGDEPQGKSAICFWESLSAKFIRRIELPDVFSTFAFCKDNKHLVVAGYSDSRVLEAATGKMIRTIKGAGGDAVLSLDGQILAAEGSGHSSINLWNVETGKKICALGQRPINYALAFSADGKTIASGGEGAIRLWDTATGASKGNLAGHPDRVASVLCTPDGRSAITEGWDGTVRLWDANSGKELRQWEVPPQAQLVSVYVGALRRTYLSPDGKYLATVRGDDVVVLWDLATGREAYKFQAASVAFSPDGKLIACAERGAGEAGKYMGLIRLYNCATGQAQSTLPGHPATIASLVFTPDCTTLISAARRRGLPAGLVEELPGDPNEQGKIRVWELATKRERKDLLSNVHAPCLALSPDGRMIAVANPMGKAIYVLETATGGQRCGLTEIGYFHDLAFSPDGRTAATPAGKGYSVRLWDLFSGSVLKELKGHVNDVTSVAFSPDGKTLISGSLDGTALIWDVSPFLQPAEPREFTIFPLERYWTNLLGEVDIGFVAIAQMVSAPKPTVAFLREHLKPSLSTTNAKRIEKLIADLDSAQFKTRDLASRELEKLGETARPALDKALAGNVPLEMKLRLELLLGKLGEPRLPPETLRHIRAVEVLEFIGTADARDLLTQLANGPGEDRLTTEAQGALARLARRTNGRDQ